MPAYHKKLLHLSAMAMTSLLVISTGYIRGADIKPNSDDKSSYLFVFFTDDTHDLFMATSDDGYSFTAVNNNHPVISGDTIAEQHGVRDPHISRGP